MIDLNKVETIFLFSGHTDLRKGITGLLSICLSVSSLEDMNKKLFVFCGRNKRSIKIIQLDYDGYWMHQKQLVEGKFQWPKKEKGNFFIDKRQLERLLEGLNLNQKGAHKFTLIDEEKHRANCV